MAVTFLVPEGLKKMSAATEYAELLKLIEISGPFLSPPIYKEVFPQGLVKDDTAATALLRESYDEWRSAKGDSNSLLTPSDGQWVRTVLKDTLAWPAELPREHNAIPQTVSAEIPQHRETLRPDSVLMLDDSALILVQILPPGQEPDKRPIETTWNASCVSREPNC